MFRNLWVPPDDSSLTVDDQINWDVENLYISVQWLLKFLQMSIQIHFKMQNIVILTMCALLRPSGWHCRQKCGHRQGPVFSTSNAPKSREYNCNSFKVVLGRGDDETVDDPVRIFICFKAFSFTLFQLPLLEMQRFDASNPSNLQRAQGETRQNQ